MGDPDGINKWEKSNTYLETSGNFLRNRKDVGKELEEQMTDYICRPTHSKGDKINEEKCSNGMDRLQKGI